MVAAPGITSLVRLQGIRSAHTQSPSKHTYVAPHFSAHHSLNVENFDDLIKTVITSGIRAAMHDMVILVIWHAIASQTWLVMVSFGPFRGSNPIALHVEPGDVEMFLQNSHSQSPICEQNKLREN